MYVCGITPYDTTHLGHAATFVWADTAARVLRHLGVELEVCRNVTDIDDVLSAAADRAGSPYDSFAAVQKFHFDRDMESLRVRPPAHEPRAHNYVRQVAALAAGLLAIGSAYEAGGTVYFRGGAVPEAAGIDRERALALAAEYGDDPGGAAKEDPFDVAVWQASTAGEPAWPSPWGPGRPGWHAECTAMALSVFGPAIDLHGGGADLCFPHHAYEAAMAEALTGVRPYARGWMQVGTVLVDGAKMAKSTGNLVLVTDLLAYYPAAALRLMLLDRPWAASWNYAPQALDEAAAKLDRLYTAAGRAGPESAGVEAADAAVSAALVEDLDVSRALAIAEEAGGGTTRTALGVLGLS